MDMINRLMNVLEWGQSPVKRYEPRPGEICSTGTWIRDRYKPSAYKGRLSVVGNNGDRGIRMLDRDAPVDLVGEWKDLRLLPNQDGVIITKLDGSKETYTASKEFVHAVVTSWSHEKGIDE
ncbi:MAG: hypothetical protein HY512_01115 [Candidatus Aenigmarchaeota archaeon]|nr:hypothetical protein [Candidatus Aenigmarchaeota archaeon]